MKITKVEEVHKAWQELNKQKQRACSWEWIVPKSKNKAIEIIEHNKKILGIDS